MEGQLEGADVVVVNLALVVRIVPARTRQGFVYTLHFDIYIMLYFIS